MTLWIFGYGSLLFRPDFPFVESVRANVAGYARRFAQGSPDHRGTPEAPGRVVTLVEEPNASTEGLLYRVAPSDAERVLEALDLREQGGYSRVGLEARTREQTVAATTWIARPDNPHWLGAGELHEMARHVQASRGPSGENRDYVLRLAATLKSLGIEDPHVTALASALSPKDARTRSLD